MLDQLTALLHEVAAEEILPRRPGPTETQDFVEPWRAEVVTAADVAAEAFLTRRLREFRDVPVIGEEASKADPSRLTLSRRAGTYWLVDPIDGTSAFAAGRDGFGSMVALVEEGLTRLAAIHVPLRGVSVVAERGAGAFENSRRLTPVPHPQGTQGTQGPPLLPPVGELGGTLYSGFLPAREQARVEALARHFDPTRSQPDYAACVEYPSIARGDKDFVFYQRLRPWDHAAGCLLLEEVGGRCSIVSELERPVPYRPARHEGPLLAARSEPIHDALLSLLRSPDSAGR